MSTLNVIEEIRKLESRNAEIDKEIAELNSQIEAINETIQERNEEKEKNSQEMLRLKKIKCCPSCGRELPEEAVFCMFCGHKLEETDTMAEQAEEEEKKPALCPKCGAPLIEGADFCMECGADVRQNKADKAASVDKISETAGTEPEKAESKDAPEENAPEAPSDGKIICPTCGAELKPGDTECYICSTPIK